MKNALLIMTALGSAAALASSAQATVYYSTNFGTGYTNGALAGTTTIANSEGQNGWKQVGTTNTTPIQVSGGAAIIGTSGQDVWRAFDSVATATAGTTLYVSTSIKVTAAQSAGDYFMFVGEPTGTTSNFYGRLFAKSTIGGILLGIQSMSGTGSATTYGTTVLNLNQTYNVVYAYDFVAGALNDTFTMYIDPNSTNRASLTSYVTAGWLSSTAEPTQLSEIGLRQGSSSNAASVSVYSLAAGNTLADVGVVPAPGAAALIGLAGFITARRRK